VRLARPTPLDNLQQLVVVQANPDLPVHEDDGNADDGEPDEGEERVRRK
jgi:hypothetical protein